MIYSVEYVIDYFIRDEVEVICEFIVVEFGQFGCGYCQVVVLLIKVVFVDFIGVVYLKLEDVKGWLFGWVFQVK